MASIQSRTQLYSGSGRAAAPSGIRPPQLAAPVSLVNSREFDASPGTTRISPSLHNEDGTPMSRDSTPSLARSSAAAGSSALWHVAPLQDRANRSRTPCRSGVQGPSPPVPNSPVSLSPDDVPPASVPELFALGISPQADEIPVNSSKLAAARVVTGVRPHCSQQFQGPIVATTLARPSVPRVFYAPTIPHPTDRRRCGRSSRKRQGSFGPAATIASGASDQTNPGSSPPYSGTPNVETGVPMALAMPTSTPLWGRPPL